MFFYRSLTRLALDGSVNVYPYHSRWVPTLITPLCMYAQILHLYGWCSSVIIFTKLEDSQFLQLCYGIPSSFAYRWSLFWDFLQLRLTSAEMVPSHCATVLPQTSWPTFVILWHLGAGVGVRRFVPHKNAAQPCAAADDWTGLLTCLIVAWCTLHTKAVCFIRLSH